MDQEGYPHKWLNTTGWHLQLQQLMVVVVEGGGGLGRGRGITVLDSEVSTLKTVMFPNLLFLKVDIETCDTLY